MSLTNNAGDKVVINAYSTTGNVEDLAMGEGNSQGIEVTFVPHEYVVKVTQGKMEFYDEQENKDPNIVDVGIKGAVAQMTNDMMTKIVSAYDLAELEHNYTTPNFDAVVDGLSQLNLEDASGVFGLVNVKTAGAMKKALKDDLKYVEQFIRTGYLGTVAGVNFYTTNAVGDDTFYLATKDAVTNFVKKGSEVEYERDGEHRQNKYIFRKTQVVALTDATQVVKCSKGA